MRQPPRGHLQEVFASPLSLSKFLRRKKTKAPFLHGKEVRMFLVRTFFHTTNTQR